MPIQFVPPEFWGGFAGLSQGLGAAGQGIGEGIGKYYTPNAMESRALLGDPANWYNTNTQDWATGTPDYVKNNFKLPVMGQAPPSWYERPQANPSPTQKGSGMQDILKLLSGSNNPFAKLFTSMLLNSNSAKQQPVQTKKGGGPVESGYSPGVSMLLQMLGAEKGKGAVPIEAHKGEYVLNKGAVALLGKGAIDRINKAGLPNGSKSSKPADVPKMLGGGAADQGQPSMLQQIMNVNAGAQTTPEEVNRIVAKVSQTGIGSLDQQELAIYNMVNQQKGVAADSGNLQFTAPPNNAQPQAPLPASNPPLSAKDLASNAGEFFKAMLGTVQSGMPRFEPANSPFNPTSIMMQSNTPDAISGAAPPITRAPDPAAPAPAPTKAPVGRGDGLPSQRPPNRGMAGINLPTNVQRGITPLPTKAGLDIPYTSQAAPLDINWDAIGKMDPSHAVETLWQYSQNRGFGHQVMFGPNNQPIGQPAIPKSVELFNSLMGSYSHALDASSKSVMNQFLPAIQKSTIDANNAKTAYENAATAASNATTPAQVNELNSRADYYRGVSLARQQEAAAKMKKIALNPSVAPFVKGSYAQQYLQTEQAMFDRLAPIVQAGRADRGMKQTFWKLYTELTVGANPYGAFMDKNGKTQLPSNLKRNGVTVENIDQMRQLAIVRAQYGMINSQSGGQQGKMDWSTFMDTNPITSQPAK